jgi:hypothetical protein
MAAFPIAIAAAPSPSFITKAGSGMAKKSRPSDGSLFDAIAAPRGDLSPSTTFHSELTAAQLAAGMTTEALVDRFAAFVRPTDVVCGWGDHAPTLFAAHRGVLPGARLDLRSVAQQYAHRKIGGLETHAGAVSPLALGRGGRRLAMLATLLRTWRGELDEHVAMTTF